MGYHEPVLKEKKWYFGEREREIYFRAGIRQCRRGSLGTCLKRNTLRLLEVSWVWVPGCASALGGVVFRARGQVLLSLLEEHRFFGGFLLLFLMIVFSVLEDSLFFFKAAFKGIITSWLDQCKKPITTLYKTPLLILEKESRFIVYLCALCLLFPHLSRF